MPSFGRGQSVADACKDTGIPRELREAPNSHYLPGAGEGSSDFAAPFHPSGDGSPGAPDGGGRGSGSAAHRSARHQQGAWRPTGARVLRLRPTSRSVRGRSGRSGRMVVSRRRAERRLRSLGRSARQLTTRTSCSPKFIRPLTDRLSRPSAIWARRTRSSVPTAARGSVSILDWHRSMPTRRTVSLLTIRRPARSRGAGQVQSPSRDSAGYHRVSNGTPGSRCCPVRLSTYREEAAQMRSQPLPGEASRRRAEEQFKTTKKVNSETKANTPS